MKKSLKPLLWLTVLAICISLVASFSFFGCKKEAAPSEEKVAPAEEAPPAEEEVAEEEITVTWLCARPADGAIVKTVEEVAKEYKEKENVNFELVIVTTPDRPSYLQKLRTLIAAGDIPDIFDIDADPFAQQLADQDILVELKSFLEEQGLYDKFYPMALKYQELPDGRMSGLPLEYHAEMTWYNKEILQKYNLEPPKTLDELLNIAQTLENNGVTPISVDGIDKWPVLRYLAMVPFRLTGSKYILDLREGKASMQDEVGKKATEFMQQIGKYFQEGFSSTDYTTAKNMFLDGKVAMYRMGTWELNSFADENLPENLKGKVGYFYLPMMEGAITKPNEYFTNSGIGMAFNKETFNSKSKDFIVYLINNYAEKYLAKQQMSPLKFDVEDESMFSSLFLQVKNDMDNYGNTFAKPWDTLLDPDTNTVMGDQLIMLAMGLTSPEEFANIIDETIKKNAPKYFK